MGVTWTSLGESTDPGERVLVKESEKYQPGKAHQDQERDWEFEGRGNTSAERSSKGREAS